MQLKAGDKSLWDRAQWREKNKTLKKKSKESPCNAGDSSLIPWVGKMPWRREWLPTPVFLPGEFHGWRSLVGYSPWGLRVRHD